MFERERKQRFTHTQKGRLVKTEAGIKAMLKVKGHPSYQKVTSPSEAPT